MITINPLSVAFVGVPGTLEGGREYSFSAKVTGGSGTNEGIYIDLGVNHGILERKNFKTDAQGEINFTLQTPATGGNLRLVARADVNNPVVQTIAVNSAPSPVRAVSGFVVTGLNGNLSAAYSGFDSVQRTVQYQASSKVALTGASGASWQLGFDAYHLINREPVYFNRFFNLVDDDGRQYKATPNNVTRSKDSPAFGLYSAVFNNSALNGSTEQSVWALPYTPALEITQPAYNFWLRANKAGRVLTVGNTLTLDLLPDNTLSASIQTSAGIQTLTSVPLTPGVWQKVALGFNGTNYYLAVDESVSQVAGTGTQVQYATPPATGVRWIELGGGIDGAVSGFRIYDWSQPPLLKFAQSSGSYDAGGGALVDVLPGDAYQQASTGAVPVTVGIMSGSAETAIQVFSRATYDTYARSYADVLGLATVASSDIATDLSIAELFPSADQPMASLFGKFVDADAGGPLQVVLSAFAWMQLRPDMETLYPSIQTFQSYYQTQQNQPLLSFAVQNLAEAVTQAINGNNFILKTLTTGMVVWGELIDASPSAANTVAAAIQNRADFWTWIRFMSLPANG